MGRPTGWRDYSATHPTRRVAPIGLSRRPAQRRASAFDLYSRVTVSRASRPERGRELATGSAEGSTAARPGRQARLEDVQKVLTLNLHWCPTLLFALQGGFT